MKKLYFRTFTLTICALLTGFIGKAQWITNGPLNSGHEGSSLAVSGATIYAGNSDSGVYVSLNNGRTWQQMNNGLTCLNVTKVFADGSKVFTATSQGLFVSTNNGANWLPADSGLPVQTGILDMVKQGSDLYLTTWNELYGIYKSTDDGVTWAESSSGLVPYPWCTALATNGTTLFTTVSEDSGVFVSTDNGASWQPARTGLPAYYVNAITCNGSNVFAATAGGGVYLTTNNGASWSAVNTGLSTFGMPTVFANGADIYTSADSGIFLSTNNGSNWTLLGLKSETILSIAINDSNIFASSYLGDVWQMSITGTATGVNEMAANKEPTLTVFPNPARGSFTVETDMPVPTLLQLFDVAGKLVLTQNVEGSGTLIDARNLPAGFYTVRLMNEGSASEGKVMVVK